MRLKLRSGNYKVSEIKENSPKIAFEYLKYDNLLDFDTDENFELFWIAWQDDQDPAHLEDYIEEFGETILKNKLRSQYKEKIEFFYYEFDNPFEIYREMCVYLQDFLKELKDYKLRKDKTFDKIFGEIKAKEQQYKGIGVYWSWDEEKAEAHWCDEGDNVIVVVADVDTKNVNWAITILKNLHWVLGEEEAEIYLDEGTEVFIKEIRVNWDSENKRWKQVIPIEYESITIVNPRLFTKKI